jgi:hypothetical protein
LNFTKKDYKAGLIEDRLLKRKRAYLQRHSYCAPCKPLDLEHSVEGRGLLYGLGQNQKPKVSRI